MNSQLTRRSPLALGLALAMIIMQSMVALASPAQDAKMSGELTASGSVMVDGAKAISGATIFTDSTISTGEKSSAIVTLPKLGRVELLPNTSMKVSFTEASLNGTLDSGRLIVTTNQGAAANVTTKDTLVSAENTQAANFTVDVECGNTNVQTRAGLVSLREGASAKQVAAGQDATAGQAAPGTRCTRLSTLGASGIGGISGGALAALLIAAAGAVGAIVYSAVEGGNDVNVRGGQGVVIVSPTR